MNDSKKYADTIIQLNLYLEEDAFELIEIWDREENNVRCNLTPYTLSEEAYKKLIKAIEDSGIRNVEKGEERYHKLVELGGMTFPETKGITFIFSDNNKCIPTSLDNIDFYKDIYPLADGYKEPYFLTKKIIKILDEEGIDVYDFKEMLEQGYLTGWEK